MPGQVAGRSWKPLLKWGWPQQVCASGKSTSAQPAQQLHRRHAHVGQQHVAQAGHHQREFHGPDRSGGRPLSVGWTSVHLELSVGITLRVMRFLRHTERDAYTIPSHPFRVYNGTRRRLFVPRGASHALRSDLLHRARHRRRSRDLWVRIIYATILFLLLWITYSDRSGVNMDAREISRTASTFFVVFAMTQLTAVVVLTPAMVAGAISQEHERRTLDHLLASQLTNSEIVLGKLAARLLHVALVLITGIPILFLVSLLGGIPPRHIVLSAVVTLATLAAVGSMSIAVSVWARRTRDAVIKAYVLLLVFLLAPPIVWGMVFWQVGGHPVVDWMAWGAGS